MLVSWNLAIFAHVRVRSKQSVLAMLGLSDQRSTIEAGKNNLKHILWPPKIEVIDNTTASIDVNLRGWQNSPENSTVAQVTM